MTVSYVAKPSDYRCRWWSVRIPSDYQIDGLDNKTNLVPLGFLRPGEDIELDEDEAVLDCEQRHRHKPRLGWVVRIGIVQDGVLVWYQPDVGVKMGIKAWASEEQWQILKRGSGDVAACLRLLLAIRMGYRVQKGV